MIKNNFFLPLIFSIFFFGCRCSFAMYTREQSDAFRVLEANINCFHDLRVDQITEKPLLTGYMGFFTVKIDKSNLPRENSWNWNQSNKKIEKLYGLSNRTRVVLQKFNARSKNSDTRRSAGQKLWLYTIFNTENNKFVASFVWCEKGHISDAKAREE